LIASGCAHPRILAERQPYYQPGTIPADAQPGLLEPGVPVMKMNWAVARVDLNGKW
jgi:hypothetical protein